MKKYIAVLGVLALLAVPSMAAADTFVWKDPAGGFTFSFPDSWRIATPDVAHTRVRITGPIDADHTTCKVEVSKDGRIKIYDKSVTHTAVTELLNRRFWEEHIGQYDNARVDSFYSPASMGDKGDGTAVHISFAKNVGGNKYERMRGVLIAGIYGDQLYVASCAAKADKFPQYADLFGSIMGSVMLDSRYHIFPTGYYRNFLKDPKLVISRGDRPGVSDDTRQPALIWLFNP